MIKNDLSDLSETTLICWRNLHPLKVQVQVNSAKKRIRSTLRQSICGSLTSQSPCPLGIFAQGNTKQGVTLSFNSLARQILFSFRGPMHNAKTVPAVQVRWRIWHPAQVSRKVTNVKEISRTNDCLQFLSPTVPFNCNLLHTQLRCSWFEHFGFKMVQSCLFLFAQRILKKNRIFKCLMANCKSFLCLLTIFVLTQSVLFWPSKVSLRSTVFSPLAWRSSERLGDSALVAAVLVVSARPAWQCPANSTKTRYFDTNSETMLTMPDICFRRWSFETFKVLKTLSESSTAMFAPWEQIAHEPSHGFLPSRYFQLPKQTAANPEWIWVQLRSHSREPIKIYKTKLLE